LITKGVTQLIFNLISRKSYCLSFTGISSHFLLPTPPRCPDSSATFLCLFICDYPIYIIQSSAKSLILESLFLQISFTYTRDSSGPKTLSCGTPEFTLTSLHSCHPTLDSSCMAYKEFPYANDYP